MIILVGQSASGKSEVVKELIKSKGFKKLVTCTTREMRTGEINDVDYHFLSINEFKNKEANNEFFETVEYNSNYYGTLIKEISDDKIVILEPNGFIKYRDSNLENIVTFFLSSSDDKRREWMKQRGDSESDIEKRIKLDKTHFSMDKLEGINFIIDSDSLSIKEMSEEIYQLYKNRLEKKI